MKLSIDTIESLKKAKCEHCEVSIYDYYDLENNPYGFPDFIPSHWYCSQYCYEQDEK